MCVQYVEMILKGMDCYNFFFRDLIFLFPSQIGAFLFLKRFLSFIRHFVEFVSMYTEGIFAPSYLQLSFRNKVVFKKIFNTLYLN